MLNVIYRGFGIACAAKALDLLLRAPGVVVAWPFVVALWIAATVGLIGLWWVRRSAAVIAVLSLGMPVLTFGAMLNQHLYLLGSVGVIVALLRPAEQLLCFRLQLSALYLFAAVAKINPVWLSGGTLETLMARSALSVPVPGEVFVPLAGFVIALEFWLVLGLWLPATRRASMVAGAALHASIPFAISADLAGFAQYIAFGTAAVSMYAAHLARPEVRTAPGPPAAATS